MGQGLGQCRSEFPPILLLQEGLPFLMPFTSRQHITLSAVDFLALLKDRHLNLPSASAGRGRQAGACRLHLTATLGSKGDGKSR